jgi:hypothetical protein
VEGKEEVPRTEYDETERKENRGKLPPIMQRDAPPSWRAWRRPAGRSPSSCLLRVHAQLVRTIRRR